MTRRTSFAKMYLGTDIQMQTGGNVQYIDTKGSVANADFGNTFTPRFIIGGTHFWGHADFYVAFNVAKAFGQALPNDCLVQKLGSGAELGMHYYPWAIKEGALRPCIGVGLQGFTYGHISKAANRDYSTAPTFDKTYFPLHLGATYASKKFLFKIGLDYQAQHDFEYAIARNTSGALKLNPWTATLGLKFWFNTNAGLATKAGLNGTKKDIAKLQKSNNLNAFYLGIGPSSTIQMSGSDYVNSKYPFLKQGEKAASMPDLVAGYYLHKADMNIGVSYRNMKSSMVGFDVKESFVRKSFMLEAYKFLGDYHGFVPFIGPTLAYENLSLTDTDRSNSQVFTDKKIAVGIIFGWDIRLTRSEWWILRTNLRYTPNLNLKAEGKKVMFDDMEFNFIQFTFFPGRFMSLRK
jgi:outer membrane protein W